MIQIDGFTVSLDIQSFQKISDLIFFEGPLLSHYMNERGDNYLFYWVDSDNHFNRWLIIRTSLETIQDYIEKKIPLYEIIARPNDGFLYMVDIDDNIEYHDLKLVQPSSLPEDYLPEMDSFYEFKIVDGIDLSAISKKYQCGVMELHISGREVKYGSMPIDMYGQIITKFSDLKKHLSDRYLKRKREKYAAEGKAWTEEVKKEIRLNTDYEFVYALAGSVRVIVRPKDPQFVFEATEADCFAQEFVRLFSSGLQTEEIKSYSETYGVDILRQYSEFVTFLNDNELGFEVKWSNNPAKLSYSQAIDRSNRMVIMNNLRCGTNSLEEVRIRGKFYSLNTRSGKYSFESTEDDGLKSSGDLNNNLAEYSDTISFYKRYDVIIERSLLKKTGQKIKVKDKMISMIEVSE